MCACARIVWIVTRDQMAPNATSPKRQTARSGRRDAQLARHSMIWTRAHPTRVSTSPGGTIYMTAPLASASQRMCGRSPSHRASSTAGLQDHQACRDHLGLGRQDHLGHQGRQARAEDRRALQARRADQDHQDIQVCPRLRVRMERQGRQASMGRLARSGHQEHQAMLWPGHPGRGDPTVLGASTGIAGWTAATAALDRQGRPDHEQAPRQPPRMFGRRTGTMSGTLFSSSDWA